MTTMHLTKNQLVELLSAKLEVATAYDAEVTARHLEDEADYLSDLRNALTEALERWTTYEAAKADDFKISAFLPTVAKSYYGGVKHVPIERPVCPIAMASRYHRALRHLAMDNRKKFVIQSRGINGDIYELLDWDPEARKVEKNDVC